MSYLPSKLPQIDSEPRFSPDLRGLVAWLEMMPRETAYVWYDTSNCLCCRFAQARGIAMPWVSPKGNYAEIFPRHIDYYFVGATEPWTYGAALKRAKEVARAGSEAQ